MSLSSDPFHPTFCTVLADVDGFTRWVVRINNHDTKQHTVDLLIVLQPDGNVHVATRPPFTSGVSWSPPIDAQRR